ncbi:F-box/LRR-repeat protein 15-like [Impatiens glandulifera]|uniref:F-box/LRR-repeat protein 15-like n=1 Tax=Impatiens glandulifera TaxID=253017 RepID=UPI001FB10A34|nr:F-box/LRR-repeat protein 15-like [Impatiens glandulifera]
MKIWCCLCFDEEEEEEKVMSRKVYRSELQLEDMEDHEAEAEAEVTLSGLLSQLGEVDADFAETVSLLRASDVGGLGYSADFSRLASSSSNVNMGLGLGEEPSSSSSSSAALVREEFDLDPLNKRPKVHRIKLQNKESALLSSDWYTQHPVTMILEDVDCNQNRVVHRTDKCSFKEKMHLVSSMFNVRGTGEDYNNAAVVGSSAIVDESNDPGFENLETRMDLTDDLLHMVFSFLEHIDLCGAAMVCKQWRAASAHEDFWRLLNFENRKISLEQFEDICRRYPNATDVNIFGAPVIHSLVMESVSSLRNLDRLTVGKGQLGETFFQVLTDCHSLRNLIINDATLGNSIQEIPISHDRLRHLQIVKCRVLRISVRCPLLKTLSLKRSSMAHAALNCPLLHDLDIASCHKLSDAAIRSAATSCPLLEYLDVSNCSCVTDETLREVASNCSSVHILNASYCPNISLESVRLLMLTVLKLHSCDGITSASMASLAYSSMLEVLELDNCNLLASVSLDLTHLQTIRLVHCRKFVDLNLCSKMLTSITVSNCPSLLRISLTSNLLQKLVLQKQESLTTLALQCQCLQEVDLTDCESLTNSICEVFNDGGGCPKLRSLVLDNCEGLTAVVFRNTSLITLSLAGCRGITSLKLTCPRLEKVSLDGCDHLEIASFCPVGLQSLNLGICPKLSVLHIEAPNMVVLELKGCGVLSEASINCPVLNSLDASFCSQLMDDCISATTASCPLLETLVLMSCPSIGPDGLSSLCQLSRLTSLDLSYTFLVNLHPVFDSCLQLKVLKLQACKYLPDSSLEPLYKGGAIPSLCELDLSYGTLCQSAIDDLLACCTQLTHLSLNGCVNLHDLNWGFNIPSFGSQLSAQQPNRMLQNLNCVGCPNIKEVRIPPAACCFHLLSLNLSLSNNLKEVDVACPNLSCLNLSNCYSLEVLKLDCPKLASLSLQSCNIDEETVGSAISECSLLETLDVRFCQKIYSVNMGRLRAACPSLKRVYSSLSSTSSLG